MRLFLIRLLKFIGAVVLILIVGTLGFLWAHFRLVGRAIRWKQSMRAIRLLGLYYQRSAFGIDQVGNVLCRELFNDLLLKNVPLRKEYGNPDETVSHVTGVNEEARALTWGGRLLAGLLNTIEEGHTQKAATNKQFNGQESSHRGN